MWWNTSDTIYRDFLPVLRLSDSGLGSITDFEVLRDHIRVEQILLPVSAEEGRQSSRNFVVYHRKSGARLALIETRAPYCCGLASRITLIFWFDREVGFRFLLARAKEVSRTVTLSKEKFRPQEARWHLGKFAPIIRTGKSFNLYMNWDCAKGPGP